MSVFVKGMEMPKSCDECPMFSSMFSYGCDIASLGIPSRYNYDTGKRPNWCPLVELPEKHGGLIDADSVIDELARAIPYYIDDTITEAYVEGLGRAKIAIEDALTVIEAEGDDVK